MRRSRGLAAVLLFCAFLTAGLASANDERMVTLRKTFFGEDNVDATGAARSDKVILSWFGVTNFAAAIGGHVVLLDAWVPRGEYSGYIPTTPDDLAALKPSHVILGHGHFDHAADAAQIVVRSGATLVGTPEHCDQVRRQAGVAVACVEAVDRGALAGATRELGILPGVGITVVKHVHSAGEPPDPEDPHGPAAPPPDANAIIEHPPSPQDTLHLLTHLADAEAGTLLYQFRVGDFAMLWHDSSGPLKERAPHVFDILKSLPPTDVQIGALMGFNQISNGMRDPRMYIEAIGPRVFVPSHHDNWAPGVSTRGSNYRPIIEEELQRIPPDRRPELLFIGDPDDYVRPEALTFAV